MEQDLAQGVLVKSFYQEDLQEQLPNEKTLIKQMLSQWYEFSNQFQIQMTQLLESQSLDNVEENQA